MCILTCACITTCIFFYHLQKPVHATYVTTIQYKCLGDCEQILFKLFITKHFSYQQHTVNTIKTLHFLCKTLFDMTNNIGKLKSTLKKLQNVGTYISLLQFIKALYIIMQSLQYISCCTRSKFKACHTYGHCSINYIPNATAISIIQVHGEIQN